MGAPVPEVVVGTTIACSFILFGNAITQSFMGVPALLVDFPPPSSPSHASRAQLLGRQWPTFWKVGNVFFRPISTLGIFGYGYTAYIVSSSASASASASSPSSSSLGRLGGDWRLYALSALCHLVTVVHSAVNMQPINEKLDALKYEKGEGEAAAAEEEEAEDDNDDEEGKKKKRKKKKKEGGRKAVDVDTRLAEEYARRWIRFNTVRLITPVVAGTIALTQVLRR
ncbi:hypothetical protein GGR50DRAFT_703421 [Xylaria sp. CBS 124048]|nr:hypothetical protein GGR50DRAFT_703421 [Xylaria sp. CBS 124048]